MYRSRNSESVSFVLFAAAAIVVLGAIMRGFVLKKLWGVVCYPPLSKRTRRFNCTGNRNLPRGRISDPPGLGEQIRVERQFGERSDGICPTWALYSVRHRIPLRMGYPSLHVRAHLLQNRLPGGRKAAREFFILMTLF